MHLIRHFYEVISSKVISKKKVAVNRATTIYSSSPSSSIFGQYCKYQLIKYKPWKNTPANAWDSRKESYCIFVDTWKEYLQTDQRVRKVTNWKKALEGTCKYENVSDNSANLDVKELELVEWIHISITVG